MAINKTFTRDKQSKLDWKPCNKTSNVATAVRKNICLFCDRNVETTDGDQTTAQPRCEILMSPSCEHSPGRNFFCDLCWTADKVNCTELLGSAACQPEINADRASNDPSPSAPLGTAASQEAAYKLLAFNEDYSVLIKLTPDKSHVVPSINTLHWSQAANDFANSLGLVFCKAVRLIRRKITVQIRLPVDSRHSHPTSNPIFIPMSERAVLTSLGWAY